VIQAVTSSVLAILLGTLSINALCRERIRCLRILGAILSIIIFITGFGAISFPGLTPTKKVIFSAFGGTLGAALLVIFSLIYAPKETYNYMDYRV
jgi:hypothetical protein